MVIGMCSNQGDCLLHIYWAPIHAWK